MSSQMFLTWPKAQGQEENRWGWKRDRGTAAPRSPQAGEDRARFSHPADRVGVG